METPTQTPSATAMQLQSDSLNADMSRRGRPMSKTCGQPQGVYFDTTGDAKYVYILWLNSSKQITQVSRTGMELLNIEFDIKKQ